MIVPPKSDPRWRHVLLDKSTPDVTGLATQMLLMRVKQLVAFSPQRMDEAIDIAHAYFEKNAATSADDLRALFPTELR